MYKKQPPTKTTLKVNETYQGETIEQKINRIVNNKEPITDGAPLIYTERKDGVEPAYDIRTDRFEIAVEAMDVVHKTNIAQREKRMGAKQKIKEETKDKEGTTGKEKKDGGPEPTQGTNTGS